MPSNLESPPRWYPGYVTGRMVFRRHLSGRVPASPRLLRMCAEHVIGAAVSGPVCSPLEVGASRVTASAPAGRPPAPPYKRNPYAPSGSLRPLEWYSQPWYRADREVLP